MNPLIPFLPSLTHYRPSDKDLLNLGYPKKFLHLLSDLDHPQKIQHYMKTRFTYNHQETAKSLSGILENYIADCFEGGVGFAYPLLYLLGYQPQIVMIQADNDRDVDHTLVVYRYGNKLGSVAMSRHDELMGKPAVFTNLYNLMTSYYPDYYSDEPDYSGEFTMIGYSDPIDLVSKFGTGWFFLPGDDALEYVYDHFTDNVMCTNIFNFSRYPYPPEN